MRDPIIVVGSGASAVHFTQTALELGRRVLMLDVGYPKPEAVLPSASLNELKATLPDPTEYFLGKSYESVILPDYGSEYYGFPPSKSYVFRSIPNYDVAATGFSPLLSFATGGLAQAWTGGSYPFSEGELEAFPFGFSELVPHYSEIAKRIGISGAADDLLPFMPWHDELMAPVKLGEHSQRLLTDYQRKRERFNQRDGFYLGHARLATLSRDHGERRACSYSGRCLWGCPSQSIYTPSITLDHCKRLPGFQYIPNLRVDHFTFDDANRVVRVTATSQLDGRQISHDVGTLVLAAGALPTARILLESLARRGVRHELGGLMDNRQVLMPFVNLKQIGRPFEDRSYQYHQLAIGVPGAAPIDYVHGLVTTLTTALIHPVVQSLPVGMSTAIALFRNIHSALGLVNINFKDSPRQSNRIAIETDPDGKSKRLLVSYAPAEEESEYAPAMISRFRRFLFSLGCVAPPNMTRFRPMGASVHYAGTLPMLADGGDFTTDRRGRCRPFENLLVVDGSTFPSLPAKNLTFTLMANASRIAHETLRQ